MKLLIGPHVHKSQPLGESQKFKTLAAAVAEYHSFADELGFNMTAAQVFVSETRRMDTPLLVEGSPEAQELADTVHRLGVMLVIHTPYVNVPWGSSKTKKIAQKAIRRELRLASSLVPTGEKNRVCSGVVVHLQDQAPADIVADLRELIAGFDGNIPDATLFLENEVRRRGQWTYSTPQEFGALATAIREAALPLNIGICLDTAHLWISGVDLRTGMRQFLEDFGRAVNGLELMLHLNDAPAPLGQGRDSHAPLGHGHIWKDNTESLHLLLKWAAEYVRGPIILERTGNFVWPDGEKDLTRSLGSDFTCVELTVGQFSA